MASAYVERLHWRDCIQRYDRPHTCFYLAPPYWQIEGYGVPFPFSEYQAMAVAMRGLKARRCRASMTTRTCFAGMHMEGVEIGYQVGSGAPTARRELVVWSWNQREGEWLLIAADTHGRRGMIRCGLDSAICLTTAFAGRTAGAD